MIGFIILSAGLGTRLKPITDSIPKCFVPIDGRPLMDFWISNALKLDSVATIINYHKHESLFKAYINSSEIFKNVHLSYEPKLLGSAGTISNLYHTMNSADHVVVVNADGVHNVNLNDMLKWHIDDKHEFTMLLKTTDNPSNCGIVSIDGNNTITSFTEKPKNPTSNLANAGVYILSADMFKHIANMNAFDLGFDVIPTLVNRMHGFIDESLMSIDIGSVNDYERAINVFKHKLCKLPNLSQCIYLDRDGTIISNDPYCTSPDEIVYVNDSINAVRMMHSTHYLSHVVTNQSRIGKGEISVEAVEAVNDALTSKLSISVSYNSHPQVSLDRTKVDFYDRKPGPGMLVKHAISQYVDLSKSYMVGDTISDILAGDIAGCKRSYLVSKYRNLTDIVNDIA